jgi:hypothetical protein
MLDCFLIFYMHEKTMCTVHFPKLRGSSSVPLFFRQKDPVQLKLGHDVAFLRPNSPWGYKPLLPSVSIIFRFDPLKP